MLPCGVYEQKAQTEALKRSPRRDMLPYVMATSAYQHKVHSETPRRSSGTFTTLKEVKEGIFKIPTLKIKNRCNYDKLKHYLNQATKKLDTVILEKADLILKYRNQVVMLMKRGVIDAAKPLVVQIEKQSQLKEAMEKCATYCDILLHRFSLLQNVKSLDDISAEAVSSLIWVSHRLAIEELRQISEQLSNKYGRCYAQACQKQQVATINKQLVSQVSYSPTSKDVVDSILLDIAEEYKITYIHENKGSTNNQPVVCILDVNADEDLLDFRENKDTTDTGCGLQTDVPLVLPFLSPAKTGASQLNLPLVGCNAPSPGGSCQATSPGGSKVWCNFDISPIKVRSGNLLTMCPGDDAQLNIPDVGCNAPSPGGSCHAISPGGTKIWCNFDVSPVKEPRNMTHQSSSSYPLECGSSRNNPFLDGIQDMNWSDKEFVTLKDADVPSIKVTNPFRDMILQDYPKASCTYQHDLFQDDTDNESSSWKTRNVEPDLLFEIDIEDTAVNL